MKDAAFWERVVEAFQTDKIPEIAKKMSLTYYAVRMWKLGRMPGLEALLKISDMTDSSVQWLVTGEGPKSRRSVAMFLGAGASVAEDRAPYGQDDELVIIRKYLARQLVDLTEKGESDILVRYLIGLLDVIEKTLPKSE